MCEIRRYSPDEADMWDKAVDASRNGTFLFKRTYMDYHRDRFEDYSLLYYDARGRLLGLLPANLSAAEDGEKTLVSHEGLTYGGLVLGRRAGAETVLDMMASTLDYLRERDIRTFRYKQMPVCYHLYPSEEDEYALWRLGAELSVCNISSTIELSGPYTVPPERRRRRCLARAEEKGYFVRETRTLAPFWRIMSRNLREKYGVKPVHTIGEMRGLMDSFPEEITLYVADNGDGTQAGALMYLTRRTAHVQYAHASPQGKEDGALDMIYSLLLDKYARCGYRFFDIGISNEDGGRKLNTNLLAQKEGFGARGTAYKQWTFRI